MEFLPRSLLFKKFHFTTKGGPNGHALFTALLDLIALDPITVQAIRIVGGNLLCTHLDLLLKYLDRLEKLLPELFVIKRFEQYVYERTLAFFPDKENKVRVIAIADYWSQTVLRPLHLYLFSVLKRITQDCTFNQGSFAEKLALGSRGDDFVSADLSAATDRFPIEVIALVLSGRLPKWYVEAWKTIMSRPLKKPKSDEFISYAVGQPMGMYSSWASFALAHHFIIFYICRKTGID